MCVQIRMGSVSHNQLKNRRTHANAKLSHEKNIFLQFGLLFLHLSTFTLIGPVVSSEFPTNISRTGHSAKLIFSRCPFYDPTEGIRNDMKLSVVRKIGRFCFVILNQIHFYDRYSAQRGWLANRTNTNKVDILSDQYILMLKLPAHCKCTSAGW